MTTKDIRCKFGIKEGDSDYLSHKEEVDQLYQRGRREEIEGDVLAFVGRDRERQSTAFDRGAFVYS